ncbi:protein DETOXIFICATION 27-like [Prosopis cineraria]|uniref:protein DETOXIFICATION 27-like n=1 Tax=Prosopis cineraria TaxID=364024 RepID=UPI00240F5184|nr:protein DETOXIFICATION 27-like [Prosopis cineraria]
MSSTSSRDDTFEQEAKLPLLRHTPSASCDTQIVQAVDEEDHLPHESLTSQTLHESKKLWKIVGPTIVFRMASYSMIVVSQAYAGHIGDLELAAISIGYNVIMGLDFGLLLGMASALETLCGQAFGAKKYHMLGVYMQRSWVVLTLCCIISLPLFLFASPILKFFGEPTSVSELTGVVANWMIPLHFCFALVFPLQRFFQCQTKTVVPAWVSLVALGLHVFLTWLFVYVFHFGVIGVTITLCLAWWNLVFGLMGYIVCGACPLTWTGFSIQAFSGLWEFLKLSASSGVMLCLETWYYRILILIAGTLKNAELTLDALSICMSINGWEMMIPLAFFAAAGVRVANELGAGNGRGAKFATNVSVLTSLGVGVVFWVLIMLFDYQIASFFSSSESVLRAAVDLKLLLAFTVLLNSVQPVISGVAVGLGWQTYVAYINLGCYYFIGLPLGYLLGWYFSLGVTGIWSGMLWGGTGTQTLLLGIMILRCDWDEEAERARRHVQKWDTEIEKDPPTIT